MRLQCMHYFNVSVFFFLVSPFRCFFLHLSIASSSLLPSTSLPSYPLHPLMHPPPPPLPFSVALLFIAMSSQGSAATKAFSCCHYNYSLHTHRHTHAHTCTLEECLCVCMHVRCVCVPVCAPACAVTHKRVSYFYLSPSLPLLLSIAPPTSPHPSLPPLLAASHICYAEHRQHQSSPNSSPLLSHAELARPSASPQSFSEHPCGREDPPRIHHSLSLSGQWNALRCRYRCRCTRRPQRR